MCIVCDALLFLHQWKLNSTYPNYVFQYQQWIDVGARCYPEFRSTWDIWWSVSSLLTPSRKATWCRMKDTDYDKLPIITMKWPRGWETFEARTMFSKWASGYNHFLCLNVQQSGVHEAPLCVLLVPESLCSSTKLTFVLMLSVWCVFHMFGCALSVCHLLSHWVRVCLLWVYVIIEHMVHSEWFQIST